MKILFVWKQTNWTNGSEKRPFEFIEQQISSLAAIGMSIDVHVLESKWQYLELLSLRRICKAKNYDLVHCHFGFSAIPCLLISRPLYVSYIGSDINIPLNNFVSSLIGLRACKRLFVSDRLKALSFYSKQSDIVLPYGVDLNVFYPIEKEDARRQLGLDLNKKYCLFPSNPGRPEKNYSGALEILKDFANLEMMVFDRWRSKEIVNLMFNACDFVIFTSLMEGSPQVIKEACATNTPVVSHNVGDVVTLLDGVESCLIFNENKVNEARNFITSILSKETRSNGREKLDSISLEETARALVASYRTCKD
tara:strand:- start:370 stop:1293 length:924 start_codon:yes stop_codon:yes gene_type:complete